ncbi:MAG: glycosyltransferase family 2 protein [Chloroflexi bacterium]|nr:glycosyltransferase family 2 protein [Chloroflexota bacterium]MCI0725302.1 glycosyltransferase family 2 protein [Chloroflexota bacterium]
MTATLSISVVVPVYNSQESLPHLVCRLLEILPTLSWKNEIILVNDGSRDSSWQVVCELAEKYTNVSGINLMRNYGQHNALLCGIRTAQHEIVITMDDDLQNPPEEIPKLLNKLNEGYDVIYGTPEREKHGVWRNIASQITKMALQNAMGAETARKISAFRAFRTSVRNAFLDYHGSFVNIDVLLTWGTTRFAAIPVCHRSREIGVSNYTFRKLITHALNMMTGFTVLPLQLASLLGFSFSLFGLLLLVFVVGRVLIEGGSVPGFPFLASVLAVFSGVQLFALGIIGEYLARMHYRLMERPPYVVRNSKGFISQ